jgi:predicted nucleic acid-binding protein
MPPSPHKKYLLLDSCIAEYWLNKEMQPSIKSQLTTWTGSTFDLAISEVSYAELIDGAKKDKVKRIKELLDSYTRIEVSQRILSGAGILSTVYKAQNQKQNGAGMQDKIIAATSFIYNLPIVTSDLYDYPHPFFTSSESENIRYVRKGKDHFITVDILRPNIKLLEYWYSKIL